MIFPSASYINSRGEEVFLCLKGSKRWWELNGRFGFGAPAIKTEDREYANGTVRTLASVLQPRECGFNMVVMGRSTRERDDYFFDMVSKLLQTGSRDDWGRLKVRRSDGKDVYLNCLYTGGFEDVVEEYWAFKRFTLTFKAGDPYFYDMDETVIRSEEVSSGIRLHNGLFLGPWRLTSGISNIKVENTGEVFYPVIEVTGPASNILIENKTTGKILALDESYTLPQNSTVIIDCRENCRGITLVDANGGKTDISYRLAIGSSLNWQIAKGTNILSMYYTGSSTASQFRIRYQKRYLSA